MTTTKPKNNSLLFIILLSFAMFNHTECFWGHMGDKCYNVNICLMYANFSWLIYGKIIHPSLKRFLAKMLSVNYWRKINRDTSFIPPILWFWTIPVRSFKKYKPWHDWNHPQYRKYHGRGLEEEETDDPDDLNEEKVKEQYLKHIANSKNAEKEAMASCTSMEDCVKKACAGAKTSTHNIHQGHVFIESYFKAALQVAYFKYTGKRKSVQYFDLKCMDNLEKDVKLDYSHLDMGQKVVYEAIEEEGDHEFLREWDPTEISGYNDFVFSSESIDEFDGTTLETDHGIDTSDGESGNDMKVLLPFMGDQVF